MTGITESMLEDTCLGWLEELGWDRIHGPDIAPDRTSAKHRIDILPVRRLCNERNKKD